ncbi:unnamed protein product [Amoebophrya sp. A25]|nr:unnamed protein product [Amoebophrya sp. A25]|eukprot:GSA25T00015641001.1
MAAVTVSSGAAAGGKKKRWGASKGEKKYATTAQTDGSCADQEGQGTNGAHPAVQARAIQEQSDGGLSLITGNNLLGSNNALDYLAQGLGGRSAQSQVLGEATTGSSAAQSEASLAEFLTLIREDEHCFCLSEAVCPRADQRLFQGLLKELQFQQMWMSGGTRLHRPSQVGSQRLFDESPTYRRIVRFLVRKFRLSDPIRSIINLYRSGDDSTSLHRDQYFGGTNFTCGVSFGATRHLEFLQETDYQAQGASAANISAISSRGGASKNAGGKRFIFPQHNGDIFAFSDVLNSRWRHSVPKEKNAGPRISLVLFCSRRGNSGVWDYEGAVAKDPENFHVRISDAPHILDHDPNKAPA